MQENDSSSDLWCSNRQCSAMLVPAVCQVHVLPFFPATTTYRHGYVVTYQHQTSKTTSEQHYCRYAMWGYCNFHSSQTQQYVVASRHHKKPDDAAYHSASDFERDMHFWERLALCILIPFITCTALLVDFISPLPLQSTKRPNAFHADFVGCCKKLASVFVAYCKS